MPIVHKTKAGGPGPPAAQVLPRSIFATGAGAARRAPSEWLRRSDKRRPRMRA